MSNVSDTRQQGIPANMAVAMVWLRQAPQPVQVIVSKDSALAAERDFNKYEGPDDLRPYITLDAYTGGQPRRSTMKFRLADITGLAIDVPTGIVTQGFSMRNGGVS